MSLLHSDSPALYLLSHGNRKVPVCGKNTHVALWAAALVDTVLRRGQETPLPTSKAGGFIKVRLTDNALSRFLLDVYLDEPCAVAEAVMALRKLDRRKASWLIAVMKRTRDLAGLARAVRVELTGEESPCPEKKDE